MSRPLAERLPVDVAAIERELSAMWQSAGADQGRGVVTRACAWNVIGHVELRDDRDGKQSAPALLEALKALPQLVATRTLILQTQPEDSNKPPLESWISANCALAEGGKYVCSEEITIASCGKGDRHLPSLVRALTVPDVPIALILGGVAEGNDAVLDALIECADRLITHADASKDASPLNALAAQTRRANLSSIDLGWIASAPLRSAISDRFYRAAPGYFQNLTKVEVSGPACTSRLNMGWIAGQLGARALQRMESRRWIAHLDGRSFEVHFRDGEPGNWSAKFTVGGETIELSAHNLLSPVESLARALASRSEDRAFQNALEIARSK